jgi:hypothetical protein
MMTEANPVLDALLQPQELDMGEIAHAASPSAAKESRATTPSSAVENGRSVRKNPKD